MFDKWISFDLRIQKRSIKMERNNPTGTVNTTYFFKVVPSDAQTFIAYQLFIIFNSVKRRYIKLVLHR